MSQIETNTTGLEEILAMIEKLPDAQAGYAEGKQAEYDAFWDAFQNNGDRYDYNHAFHGWPESSFQPKYPIQTKYPSAATYMIAYNEIEDTKVDISFGTGTMASQTFYSATALITIRKIIVLESTTYTDTFKNCTALVNLTVEGIIGQSGFDLQYSTVLSKTSIQSVIAALSDNTTDLTVTLSLQAVNSAFETSSGAEDGSNSSEWLNLVATKPNWTVSLI